MTCACAATCRSRAKQFRGHARPRAHRLALVRLHRRAGRSPRPAPRHRPASTSTPQRCRSVSAATSLNGSTAAMYGRPGGQDRIQLARHDVAGEARLQRHQADVARRVGPAQLIARLKGKEPHVVEAARARPPASSAAPPVAVADEQEDDVACVDFSSAAASITTSRFCDSPMLPACSTTNRSSRPCAARKRIVLSATARSPWCRPSCESRSSSRRRRPCRGPAATPSCRRARRSATARRTRKRFTPIEQRVDQRTVKILEQAGDFRKDVLAEEHHAAPRPRRQRRQPDDRRIGQRHRHVLPRQAQRRSTAPTGNR